MYSFSARVSSSSSVSSLSAFHVILLPLHFFLSVPLGPLPEKAETKKERKGLSTTGDDDKTARTLTIIQPFFINSDYLRAEAEVGIEYPLYRCVKDVGTKDENLTLEVTGKQTRT